jgi:hypothetical protein
MPLESKATKLGYYKFLFSFITLLNLRDYLNEDRPAGI